MKAPKKKDAFTDSDKHVLDGIKLYPWTPARIIAGQSMGMLYPEIGKEGRDQYRRTKTYPGVIKDVAICLWLCTVDPDRVDEADGSPGIAYAEAKQWALRLGIHRMGSSQWEQAFQKFAEIAAEVDDSITVPSSSEGNSEEGADPPN